MDANRELKQDIEKKTTKYLKHLVYRKLRVENVDLIQIDENETLIKTSVYDPSNNLFYEGNVYKTDYTDNSDLVKDCVKSVVSKMPQDCFAIKVKDFKKGTNDVLSNMNKSKLRDSFILEKIPYRQLQIKKTPSSEKFFLDLGVASYTRVLNLFNSFNTPITQISFTEIGKCLKRKEIVKLLLYFLCN